MNPKKLIRRFVSMSLLPHVLVMAIMALVICIACIANNMTVEDCLMVSLLCAGMYALCFGLCFYLPSVVRVSRSLKELENKGQLCAAAKELCSSGTVYAIKNRVAVSENFVFAKGYGACAAGGILWMYRRRNNTRFLFIPIATVDFLMFHTAQQQYAVTMYKKDKQEELKRVMYAIYQKNPQMLTGYSAADQKEYNRLRKQIRSQNH